MPVDAITRRLVALALEEDLGPGDVTSRLLPQDQLGAAHVVARKPLVVAGCDVFSEVFSQLDPSVRVTFAHRDGAKVEAQTVLGRVEGPARSILAGERTALNLIQRLSGVATMAARAQEAVAGTKAKVVDTRKTTPGMRTLEKAAVAAGGAHNHRFGLFDGVLIKDNHVRAAGGVKKAIAAARASVHHLIKIECEVDTLAQVDEALEGGADIILLDNMDLDSLRQAVLKIGGRAVVEASGGVTLDTLPGIAATGVDLISMGALTHSAPAVDVALDWE